MLFFGSFDNKNLPSTFLNIFLETFTIQTQKKIETVKIISIDQLIN